MLEFLVDNIIVVFVGKVFQQIAGIPIGTNCALHRADIFFYSYEAEFIQSLISMGSIQLASRFNVTDVLSTKSLRSTWVRCIMWNFRSKTLQNATVMLLTWIYSCRSRGTVNFTLPKQRDDFNFHITSFPFLSSNIPFPRANVVFISQLMNTI